MEEIGKDVKKDRKLIMVRFKLATKQTVLDNKTGLTWQQSGSEKLLTYQQALDYVKELNKKNFAGFNDWRLPTVSELLSIMDLKEPINNLYINPVFDKYQRWCWSSDKNWTELAWLVSFGLGIVYWANLSNNSNYVRAVRS